MTKYYKQYKTNYSKVHNKYLKKCKTLLSMAGLSRPKPEPPTITGLYYCPALRTDLIDAPAPIGTVYNSPAARLT